MRTRTHMRTCSRAERCTRAHNAQGASDAYCSVTPGGHGVVVSHPLRMRKALGSIPSVSIQLLTFYCLVAPWLACLSYFASSIADGS